MFSTFVAGLKNPRSLAYRLTVVLIHPFIVYIDLNLLDTMKTQLKFRFV